MSFCRYLDEQSIAIFYRKQNLKSAKKSPHSILLLLSSLSSQALFQLKKWKAKWKINRRQENK